MKPLPSPASDKAILDVVRRWVEFLAQENYAEALRLVDSRPHWTPDLLARVIRNYGSTEPRHDGRISRVTPMATASGGPVPRHEVDLPPDGHGSVWFDLPIDGAWSDLTATFDVVEVPDGVRIVLDDVHVM